MGLRDVAERVGVSAVTVSNAFNRPDQLSAALRERILAAAAELGYAGPEPSARSLRTGRAGAIALYNPDPITYLFEDPVATGFLAGLSEVAQAHQVGLVILPGPEPGRPGPTAIDTAAVDGFIVYTAPRDDPALARIARRGKPVVAVDHLGFEGAVSVGIDDRAGARAMAEHVLGLGHSRVAVIAMEFLPDRRSGPVDPARRRGASFDVTRLRLQGFEDALAARGLDPAAVPVFEVYGNGEGGGYEAASRLLSAEAPPSAILCMSDRLALGAIRAAADRGLRVPEDLSVTGFDDIPEAGRAVPGLTTMRQDSREKGRVAAGLLLGDRTAEGGRALLPLDLVLRGSTARAQAR